jgi:hypothetical protein
MTIRRARVLFGIAWLLIAGAAPALTAPPSVTPTGELGTLHVSVAEFPDGCQGAMRGVLVSVTPGGITQATSLTDGSVDFTLAPGTYTLTVGSCNPFGCWPARVVEVVPGNQSVRLCPLAFTPTPTPTATPSATPVPTGVLGEKTTDLRVFDLLTALPVIGAPVACTGPREQVSGASDDAGRFACTLELRDSDTVLIVAGAPGYGERRRGYNGLDLWRNTDTLQVGLIPDGYCGGDCNHDLEIDIAELVRAVGFALADGTAPGCPLADIDGDGRVAVNDLVAGVQRGLTGCPP